MNDKVSDTLSLLCQNAVDVIDKAELRERLENSLKNKKPLRIKAGFDPSAPDIHLGHTVLLRKLRQFQDAGHHVVFIIGDYTAMIGDPTGRSQTRPALSLDEVAKNAQTYQDQAYKFLDKSKTEFVRNSSWFLGMNLVTFLEDIATRYTVARILERDDFEKRMSENQPITIREFLYPMLQGYDSVQVRADVEIGGSDQKFNLLVGRNLQRAFGLAPQIVMTLPLLVGLDGTQKMSKSYGNYIAVNDSPRDVFGKAMSVPDALMPLYFNLLTTTSGDEIRKSIESGKLHPREAKVQLAKALTSALHGEQKANFEEQEFNRVFRDKQNPENPQALEIDSSKSTLWIVELLEAAGIQTRSEARRLIEQGAVTLDGNKMVDPKAQVTIQNASTLRAGKTRFFKIILK